MSTPRQQSWRDEEPAGRLVVVSDNPVSQALVRLAEVVGREVVLLADDEDGHAVAAVADLGLTDRDALVLCDHDAPDAPRLLRDGLASAAAYVAMLGSRRRAEGVLAELAGEGVAGLEKLHVPAGLDTGGRSPGEMALSLLAEVVADAHGRTGGSMRLPLPPS